jgi:hypothetical protein
MSNVTIPVLPASPPEYNGDQITRNFDDITKTMQQIVDEIDESSSGGVTDGDKGDITVSGSGTTWTIDASAVTNAKLANVPTATLKGRAASGTGEVTDLTGTQVTALLDTFTTTAKGLVPAATGGNTTTEFVRKDGTFAVPFTEAQVRSTPLTGFVAGTDTAIVATDTILQFANKTQGQINRRSRVWRDWVDARDYGLLMDNLQSSAAANTTALQNAINTGKIVTMPDGDFYANAITVDTPYQQILGTGKTRWRQPSTFNGNLITINLAAEGAKWQGMRFDGNRGAVTYSYNSGTFAVFAAGFTADDLELKDIQSMGIRGLGTCHDFRATRIKLENVGDFPIFVQEIGGVQPINGTIRDIRIKEFGLAGGGGGVTSSVGIGVRSATGGWVVDDFKIQCDNAYTNDQLGVEFWTNSNANTVSNGHVIYRGAGTGEFGISATGRNNIVSNIRVEGTDSYAFEIMDPGCAVSTCVARDPRGAGFAMNVNTAHPNSVDQLALSGCVVENANSTNPSFAAFVIDGVSGPVARGVSISGCSASGSATLLRVGSQVDGFSISGGTWHKTGGTNNWMILAGSNGTVSGATMTRDAFSGTIPNGILIAGSNISIGGECRINGFNGGTAAVTNMILINAGLTNIKIGDINITGSISNSVFCNSTATSILVAGGMHDTGVALQANNRAKDVYNTTTNTFFNQ